MAVRYVSEEPHRVAPEHIGAELASPARRGVALATDVPLLAALLTLGCALAAAPSRAADFCPAFPPATGDVVVVSTVAQLRAAVDAAVPGRTILVADGTYALDGEYLRLDVPNVTLRGRSGQRDAVVLDGNYLTTEIVQVAASDVTVADLTLREAYDHPIHVMPAGTSATNRTLVYNVRIVDPGQQAIKINPESDTGPYVDEGTIACSRLELTDAGRPHVRDSCYTGGVDAHAALGWTVRDNVIEGFWCEAGLSEHAIHFWRNARDTRVERNVLRNNARGIGFGLAETGTPRRTYADAPCPAAGGAYVDHYGGTAVNNFVSADDPELFASEYGFDCGICLWQACGASALHNTVHTADVASSFSAIEWRFSRTTATIANNLANFSLRARDGASATQATNVTTATAAFYVSPATGDLHLQPTAAGAIDQGSASSVGTDFDGDSRPRGTAPDVGADETGAARALRFHPLAPCRIVDTRSASLGGPAPLAAGVSRSFQVSGACGVPAGVTVVSANVTVTQATASGSVVVHANGTPVPITPQVAFAAGRTRANNAILGLDGAGLVSARAEMASGSVHLIVDVSGYFD